MTAPVRSPARAGVALVIALVILAALLLLGLPFLFSQSESLAGSRSLAYHQSTAVGLTNGEQLAAAAVAEGMQHHLEVDGDAYTRQHDDLLATNLMQSDGIITDNTFALDTSGIATGGRQARSGAWIEDEHGKLNPNYLSPRAWTILLDEVGIQDWDDDQVLDSEDHRGDPATPTSDDDGRLGLDGLASSNGDNDDGNDTGELAEALANVRFTLPGRRITHLDQLLLADPGHHDDDGPGGGAYTGPAGPNGSYGFRRPLTRAELDRLRPYLTLYTPAPGRDGLVDLGNFVAQKTYSITQPDGTVTDDISYILLDEDPYDFIRTGSAATWPEVHNNESYQFSRVHGLNARDYSTSLRLDSFPAAGGVAGPTFYGKGLAIAAPPRVNLHHAVAPVAAALQMPAPPDPFPADPFRHVGDLPANYFLRIDPLSTGVELPPVGIASKGVISVTAGAAAADQLGRVASERHRRTVLQAVPTQIDLEERWRAQDEFHALTVQRFTSRMVTWPKPTERVDGMRPDIALGPGPSDAPIGLGVAPMPSLATGYRYQRETNPLAREPSHLNIDFRVPFGADKAVPEATMATDLFTDRRDVNDPKVSLPGVVADAADLRPDGLRITGSFTWRSAAPGGSTAVAGPLRPVNLNADATADRSLTGRHVSLWFKPHNDWANNVMYPLIELRTPNVNLGDQINGTLGSNELQNRLSVVYDRERQVILTILAPPIIEHTVDWGTNLPFDDLDPSTSAHLDERALGDPSTEAEPYGGWASPWNRLAPLAPMQPYPGALDPWDEDGARYTAQVSRLYKPNTVVHVYKLADPSTPARPFFRKDRWYHLNLVLGGDHPGDVLTIIDGMVGQDVSRTPPASADAMVTGDRLTLPAMPLLTALPLVAQPPAGGGNDYRLPEITVQPVLGLTAAELFPQRGVLRIDDEYIAYERVENNTFYNCQRAQRQNTQTDDMMNPANQWPLTQEHLPGALVVPGGFRIGLGGGTLYRGGAQLAAHFGNGDPVAGPDQWRIWARIDHTPSASVVPHPSNPAQMRYLQTADTLPLRLDPGHGVPAQFPLRGIVRIGSQYLSYNGIVGGVLQNIENMSDTLLVAPAIVAPRSDVDFNIPDAANPAPTVTLVGFPLTGADPLEAGRYAAPTGAQVDTRLLQVRHATSGRIEWVHYTHFATSPIDPTNVSYVFFGTRGQQRTDFVGNGLTTRLTIAHFFPTGSPVLPVQTEIGSPGHWLATGDVVTLSPRVPEVGPVRPRQVVVRYATVDGLDLTGGNAAPDTKNEYFAFDHELPEAINAANFEMLVWPGWSGIDLTPMNPSNGLRGAPPRFDLAAPGADPTAGIELAFLSRHPVPIAPAEAAALRASDPLSSDATIDALVGGQLDGPFFNPGTRRGLVRGVSASGDVISDLATVGAVVEASHTNFFPRPFGLVAIQGEVFAYRQLRRAEATALGIANPGNNQHALLIGRGLLDLSDSAPTVVNLPQAPLRGAELLRPLVSAIPLPIGPVAQLTGDITDHAFFTLDTGLHQRGSASESVAHGSLDAPVALITNPTGAADAVTMVGFAGGATVRRSGSMHPNIIHDTEYVTAPWLRGLYNTDPAAAGQAGDIVIGWWPRLPSALPSTFNGDAAPYYRSRRFGWVGFPMAMHGARFDLAGGVPAGVTIDNAASTTDDLLVIEARAAAQREHDWTRPALPMVDGYGALTGLGPLFTGSDFFGNEVSGAELRVTWRYADTIPVSSALDAIAEAGSRGPFISSAFLRWRAPMAVLAVEEAR